MPSVSKKQQKFMGIVRAIQKGEADPSDFNKDAQDAAKKMKKTSVKKYAKTKHKGLPTKKVNEQSWHKDFKGYSDKELKVISKFIFMNDKGIDGVIKMSKHKPFAFRRTIQKMAKKGLHEAKVETERYFGKKGIIIMIRDGNKMISAIFKDKKNADKFNRNKPADVKKLVQLAKKTKYPKAIDEGGLPQNWMSGRTSDYHTKLRGKRRNYDDTNFEKSNTGQPDIPEEEKDNEIVNEASFDKVIQ